MGPILQHASSAVRRMVRLLRLLHRPGLLPRASSPGHAGHPPDREVVRERAWLAVDARLDRKDRLDKLRTDEHPVVSAATPTPELTNERPPVDRD